MKKLIFVIFLLVVAFTCHSQNVYVSNSGNDNNTGTQSNPFKTIGRAIVVDPKDTIQVVAGTYTEYINKLSFGADGKEIIISAPYQTVTVTFKGSTFILQDDNDVYSIYTELKDSYMETSPWIPNSAKVYYNTTYTIYTTKNDCPIGYVGSNEAYIVVSKLYSSLISQVDAQNKAKADALRNKQIWANQKGVCNK